MKIIVVLKRIKNKIHRWWAYLGNYKLQKILHPTASFFIFSCDHSNLGDHALSYVAKKFFEEKRIKLIEVKTSHVLALKGKGLGFFGKRTIYFSGGGNLGTLWYEVEEATRRIISLNPKARIIILPNSIYYEDSDWGRGELENSIKIYNVHKNLTIYAREKTSYEIMKKIYKDVRLVPDLVLSLDESDRNCDRKGCILCLRSDVEKTRSKEQEEIIVGKANEIFENNVQFFDMVREKNIAPKDRGAELNKAFEKFAGVKLVITDRLHAMIFAAITGTPCIVVNSKSPKVKGCYEWIKHLDYIKFCEDVERIEEVYRSIPNHKHKYDNSPFVHYYNKLKDCIVK